MNPEDDAPGEYSSPPCFMHELDPQYAGLDRESQAKDVQRWRKAERKRLIEKRLAISPQDRRALNAEIASHLAEAIGDASGKVVSAYWPFRGEPDLRALLTALAEDGAHPALPVVLSLGRPLIFRAWKPGDPLDKGIWNIPIPREDAPEAIPDIVIAPVIGFDAKAYRLGFGGGFYDRTLAALPKKPRILGVGYSLAEIPTIYPQWHDIPMDMVITEKGRQARCA